MKASLATRQGHSTHPAERHWRPAASGWGCVARRRWALNPPSRKALETKRLRKGGGMGVVGHSTHPAERHWRHDWPRQRQRGYSGRALNPPSRKALETDQGGLGVCVFIFRGTQPTQPKGIGDSSCSCRSTGARRGHSTHPAERHWRPKLERLGCDQPGRALNPPSRKALETCNPQ